MKSHISCSCHTHLSLDCLSYYIVASHGTHPGHHHHPSARDTISTAHLSFICCFIFVSIIGQWPCWNIAMYMLHVYFSLPMFPFSICYTSVILVTLVYSSFHTTVFQITKFLSMIHISFPCYTSSDPVTHLPILLNISLLCNIVIPHVTHLLFMSQSSGPIAYLLFTSNISCSCDTALYHVTEVLLMSHFLQSCYTSVCNVIKCYTSVSHVTHLRFMSHSCFIWHWVVSHVTLLLVHVTHLLIMSYISLSHTCIFTHVIHLLLLSHICLS